MYNSHCKCNEKVAGRGELHRGNHNSGILVRIWYLSIQVIEVIRQVWIRLQQQYNMGNNFHLCHRNLECIQFVTQARGRKAPNGERDKKDTLQIAMI